jgi:xylulokinase
MSLLGIDIGTTGCKAAVFSLDGSVSGQAYREYPVSHPEPAYSELDSRHVMGQVKAVIAEAAAETEGDPVEAIGISSMGEAMTPVSRDRKIIGNSILHTDPRGGEYAQALVEKIGLPGFYAINPNIPGPNYSMPKLAWIRDNQPALFARAWKFLLWGDLAGFLLGGEAVTGYSLANRTLLFDIHAEAWSERLLNLAEIPREKLPDTAPAATVAGKVSPAVAKELGLPPDTLIVTGGHDQCCNSLGAGVYSAGKATAGIGTVECISPSFDHIPDPDRMRALNLPVEHQVLPGIYLSFIYNQSGSLVKWFRDTFAREEKRNAADADTVYEMLMDEMPPEPGGLIALPHFEPTGSPDFIMDSAGVIAGLKTTTPRGEILKALIEGATFHFQDSIGALAQMGIDTSEIIATGGGAKSDAWLQIKADIMGVPLVRPVFTECGVLGAAMLAGMASGAFGSAKEGVDCFVRRGRVFEPDADRHARYRDAYARYRRIYPALRDLLRELH